MELKDFSKATFDMNFCVKTANVEFFDTFGSKIQRSFMAYVHDDDKEALQAVLDDIIDDKHYSGIVRLRGKDDKYFLTLLTLDCYKGVEEDLIDGSLVDISQTINMYYNALEREAIVRQHLINMELICFEYTPSTRQFDIFLHALNQRVPLYSGDFKAWVNDSKNKVIEEHKDTFQAMCFDIDSCKDNFTYRFKSSIFTKGENIEENIIRCSKIVTTLGNTYIVGTVASVVNNSTLGVESTYVRAYKDPMTGVLNKASIIRLIKTRIQNLAPKESIVIAILDLDNFKLVNDTFGHLYGDKILIQFSDIISRCVGTRGIIGRFGGDEFMVMLENIKDELDLRSVLRSIRTSVEMEFKDIGDNISLTTSIGAATFPKDAKDYDELFTKADYCLYLSKMRGKNRYVMFDYMIKEHHYLEDKLMLKKDHASVDRLTFAQNMIDMLLKQQPVNVNDVLAAVGERFKLDRIRVFIGSDLELKYHWGDFAPEESFVCIYEDHYLDEFSDSKNFVINYTSNIEASHPQIYRALADASTEAAVQYLIGNKQHVEGLISYEMTQKGNHWPDDFTYSMTLIGYALEAMAFNPSK